MPTLSRRKGGGSTNHKNPDCKCFSCAARRRKAETFLITTRARREALADDPKKSHKAPVNPDLPDIYVYGRSARDRIEQWAEIRLKNPELKNMEIAKMLGIAPGTLKALIVQANREGWLKFDNPIERIDFEIIPKVMNNLSEFLDQKDKTVTIETAKGTIFKQFQDAKGISDAPQTILALKLETVDVDDSKVLTGHVVGKPREINQG